MSGLVVDAPGKVNLFLRILAREASGYHGLETLLCGVGLADRVHLERRPEPGLELSVEGRWDLGPDEDNLVARAARAFRDRADLGDAGVALRLEKRIPPGSGLGGGSSDAAATLRGLNRLFGMPLADHALLRIAGGLGSDVPFFLSPSPLALGWSRGERLLALPPLPVVPVLLAVPDVPSSTPEAYGRLARRRDEDGGGRPPDPRVLSAADLEGWSGVSALAVNDFEPVVCDGRPEIRALLDELRDAGAGPALLSGSGSAVFGVFRSPERAEEVREALSSRGRDGVDLLLTRTLEAWPAVSPVRG